jgi:hypothetical protein
LKARNRNIQLGDSIAAPVHRQLRARFVALDRDNDLCLPKTPNAGKTLEFYEAAP